MYTRGVILSGFSLFSILVAATAYAAVTETFDSGQGVWDKGTYYSQLEYRGSGGNPGGWIMFSGSDRTGLATKSAPFIGDYAAAGYDEIAVDLNVQLMPIIGPKPDIFIRAGSGVAGWFYTLTMFSTQGGVWVHYTAPLNANWSDADAIAAGWKRDTGPEISFADTMRQVWDVGVRLRYVLTTAAFIGVDNFTLRKKPGEAGKSTLPKRKISPRAPTVVPRLPLSVPAR